MVRLTNQYAWNIFFSLVFVGLLVAAVFILEQHAYKSVYDLTVLDYVLITLATWRLIRLFVYDAIMKFFREQFLDETEIAGVSVLVKPDRGPRCTLTDLFSCPWCFGIWAAALVIFFYLLTPYAFFAALLLAISAVASFLQILTNMVGWKAEQLKHDVSSR